VKPSLEIGARVWAVPALAHGTLIDIELDEFGPIYVVALFPDGRDRERAIQRFRRSQLQRPL
jgi:hypothetical protein